MKIKAIIVDDEHSGRASIRILLKKHFTYLFEKIDIASTLSEAQKKIKEEFYHICFLDIQLGNFSGFDLLPCLQAKTKVIFVTAYSEHAIRAIKESAFDYILKPINPIELQRTILRFEHLTHEPNHHILIKEQGKTIPVSIAQIEYLEADGAYSIIHLINDKKYTTSKTLKVISKSLGKDFIRIHKSYMVNKVMIKSYKKELLTTTFNKCLPVSRLGAKELSLHF
ncbi:MAG: response regulator [Chitinophagaceae bacterium]|nr:response regulator [Chitinophagaceae bacterium]